MAVEKVTENSRLSTVALNRDVRHVDNAEGIVSQLDRENLTCFDWITYGPAIDAHFGGDEAERLSSSVMKSTQFYSNILRSRSRCERIQLLRAFQTTHQNRKHEITASACKHLKHR